MAATGCLAAALAFGVTACGGSDNDNGGGGSSSSSSSGSGGSKSVTIYSSMPLQGSSRASTTDLVNAEKLALEQAGGKAGDISVKFVSLDDSTAQAGNWTPEAASANARKAAQDKSTAVYLGEFNSGASAVSIPILNEAGVPQISPANTYVGLTSDKPGHVAGEPDKYYPTGTRTYARIVPIDTIQGAADVTLMKQDGCTKVAMVNDKEVYGQGVAGNVVAAAKSSGDLQVVMNDGIDPKAPNYRSLAQKAKGLGADCFFFAGTTQNGAVQASKDFAAALGSNSKIYGPDGVCQDPFVNPKSGGIPASLAPRTKCTVATLPPDEYPAAGQQFFDAFTQKYGKDQPDPYAIYGYEAMSLALDAIKRSGTGEKADVLKALFATKDRQSVLGTYSIDPNGDTSLTEMALDTVEDGKLKFDKVVKGTAQ
jgi:branched-chain amino acid transport system substrate-binding protein